MRNNTCCSLQGSGQFWQRNITILRNQLFQKCAMGCELTMPFGASLRFRRDFPSLANLSKPANTSGC